MPDAILWIEDRPDSVINQITFCQDKGLHVWLVANPHDFLQRLKKDRERIGLIIVDVMLYGVNDLGSIGSNGCHTDGGSFAGWVLSQTVLRPREGEDPYASIPLLIISTRVLTDRDKEFLRDLKDTAIERGHAEVQYLEKGRIDKNKRLNWSAQFKQIVEGCFPDKEVHI
jgi:hypothetical protein